MDKQIQFCLYGLFDPRTDRIRYVGKSTSGLGRPKRSLCESSLRNEEGSHKTNWIRLLKKQGMTPLIRILETAINAEDLPNLEKVAIARFREQGEDLVNATDGGEGTPGFKPSAQTIQKRRLKMLGRRHTSTTIKNMSISALKRGGVPHRPETKQKISEALSRLKKPFRDETGNLYYSLSEASSSLGINRGNISLVLNGKLSSSKGHTFSYEEVC